MRLSEAIRLGAMTRPQAFGALSKSRRVSGWRGLLLGQREMTTCAIGAAIEAGGIGTKPYTATADYEGWRGSKVKAGATVQVLDIPQSWENVWNSCHPCPMDCCASLVFESVSRLIPHLNDVHGWTRERIADWVESVERKQESATVEPTPAHDAVRLSVELPVASTRDA